MPASPSLRLRAPQLAADGFLCPGADRARRARAWRGNSPRRRQSLSMGQYARTRARRRAGLAPRLPAGRRPGRGRNGVLGRCERRGFETLGILRHADQSSLADTENVRRRRRLPLMPHDEHARTKERGSIADRRYGPRAGSRRKIVALFAAAGVEELAEEPDPVLPALGIGEQVVADYQTCASPSTPIPCSCCDRFLRVKNFRAPACWREVPMAAGARRRGWCWFASGPAMAR